MIRLEKREKKNDVKGAGAQSSHIRLISQRGPEFKVGGPISLTKYLTHVIRKTDSEEENLTT